MFEESLAIREKVLGHDHPDTILCRQWLGEVLCKQGDYENAEPVIRAVAETRRRVQGPNHRDYASALNNLAGLFRAQVSRLDSVVEA